MESKHLYEGSFADHFSGASDDYARFRPLYPSALFDVLSGSAPARALAWDVATGTGQAARSLAERFDRVIATDASATQIATAEPHPRITYLVESAERSSLSNASADLIVVAQALHWLDLDAFYEEVRRVARPNGVLAAWTYGLGRIELPRHADEANVLLQELYGSTLGAYWPPERRHVESGYRTLPFPFARIPLPRLEMGFECSFDELMGYLGTWSACKRFIAEGGKDPRLAFRARLEPLWGDISARRAFRFPLTVLAGRVDARNR